MRIRNVVLVFGLLNACLYSALLPLWEGFDEAFHYSYVETLLESHRLPVLGRTLIPLEISKSFELAPVSHIVQREIREATRFEDWFPLAQTEKDRRRTELDQLRASPENSLRPNYEAHHPPLAYVLLALADWPIAKASLTIRVLVLRLCAAVFSIILLYFGTTILCREVQLPEAFANAALFTIFCSQMLYATIAHVANDWLAVGVSALFLASLAVFVRAPGQRSALVTAFWLTAGLLTKAYFLVFVPLAFGAAAILIRQGRARVKAMVPGALLLLVVSGPWYARNLVLYKDLAGTHEQFDGIGFRQAMAAAPQIDWIATANYLARASLWTGNNSFTSFSRGTLTIVLVLLVIALAAWVFRGRSFSSAEKILSSAVVLFSIAVAYASCASFADLKGVTAGASPWYTQVILAPVIVLAYLGMSRWNRIGSVLAALTVGVWAWVLIATWTVKLFPLYSGAGAAPMRLAEVWDWYAHKAGAHLHDLSLLALAPAPLLYVALMVSVLLSIGLSVTVIRRLR